MTHYHKQMLGISCKGQLLGNQKQPKGQSVQPAPDNVTESSRVESPVRQLLFHLGHSVEWVRRRQYRSGKGVPEIDKGLLVIFIIILILINKQIN